MSDMISTNETSLDEVITCPWTGAKWTMREQLASELKREQVRQRLVAVHSSAPFYQARAAKDPEYWNTFYLGAVR